MSKKNIARVQIGVYKVVLKQHFEKHMTPKLCHTLRVLIKLNRLQWFALFVSFKQHLFWTEWHEWFRENDSIDFTEIVRKLTQVVCLNE